MYTTTTNEVNVNSQALDTLGNRKEQKSLRTTKKEKENTARGSRFFLRHSSFPFFFGKRSYTHSKQQRNIYERTTR